MFIASHKNTALLELFLEFFKLRRKCFDLLRQRLHLPLKLRDSIAFGFATCHPGRLHRLGRLFNVRLSGEQVGEPRILLAELPR